MAQQPCATRLPIALHCIETVPTPFQGDGTAIRTHYRPGTARPTDDSASSRRQKS